MKLKHIQRPFEIKSLEQDGSFAGYGSVFGNTDLYGDVVMPGAFSKSLAKWKAKGEFPPILWQHRSDQPIGPFTSMTEDEKGLFVEGQLLVKDVQQAREAYALIKAKAIKGMSIGYDVDEDGFDYDAAHGIMKLTAVNLWEISIATFPANTAATITDVKEICSGGELPTLRVFEGLLRDAGFSRKQATDIAHRGFVPLLQREADGGAHEQKLIDEAVALIENASITI